jgi:hypothetical protein
MKVRCLCAGRLVAQCCRQAVRAADCGAAGGVWPQEEVGEHALEGGRGHLHAQVRVQLTRGRLLKANIHASAANSVEVEKSKCRRPVKDFWTPCSSCLLWRNAKAGRLLVTNVVKKRKAGQDDAFVTLFLWAVLLFLACSLTLPSTLSRSATPTDTQHGEL